MNIFISSTITGMQDLRQAAREVIETLRHKPVMAEDLAATPSSPQLACLSGLRESDLVVLILGRDYGALQPSGVSATHEEYREAKLRKPILVFVQQEIEPDLSQKGFISEVESWESGYFRAGYKGERDFRTALTRALHDYELANAVGPVNEEDLLRRALALTEVGNRGYISSNVPSLTASVAGAPQQRILRPTELEKNSLADELMKRALFGNRRILDYSVGATPQLSDSSLLFKDGSGSEVLLLNEEGSIRVRLNIKDRANGFDVQLVQSEVEEQMALALDYASWTLDFIDPTQRLTHLCVATVISNADHFRWSTARSEEGGARRMRMPYRERVAPVHLMIQRASLRLEVARVVEDLAVLLRRQWG